MIRLRPGYPHRSLSPGGGNVGDRVSQIILLCEDDPHAQLVRRYLKKAGLDTNPPVFIPRNASREVHGGNVGWVLREFPRELVACRHRHSVNANTLLIAIVDADHFTVAQRRAEMVAFANDPVVVLIPRRHVETWIRAVQDLETIDETTDYKRPEPSRAGIRDAADQIYAWAHGNPLPSFRSVPSLSDSLAEWRKIG